MSNRVWGRGRLLAAAVLCVLLGAGRAGATPLNLITGTPDITASYLNFAFNGAGGVCGAGSEFTLCYSGDPAFISSVGLIPDIVDAVPYELLAAVDPTTGLLGAAGGTLLIGGYLTGDIVNFGYAIDGGAAVLEFVVDITGGSLVGQIGGSNLPGCTTTDCIGVIGAIFDWGFADISPDLVINNTANLEMTDNFAPLPEPATLCLLGAGLLAASAARRRQAKGGHR